MRDDIIRTIESYRRENRPLYKELEALGTTDETLKIVIVAYALSPKRAREIHRQIAANDARIWELTVQLSCD